MTESPLEILRTVFGHHEFRGLQADVVDEVVAGRDAVVLFPTGAGKSVCYQVPALCRPGTGIVISPLIALMQRPGGGIDNRRGSFGRRRLTPPTCQPSDVASNQGTYY